MSTSSKFARHWDLGKVQGSSQGSHPPRVQPRGFLGKVNSTTTSRCETIPLAMNARKGASELEGSDY
jgi:hypothetical protein